MKTAKKPLMTYRMNAAEHSLTVHAEGGDQRYDLTHFNANEREKLAEMVRDYWTANRR